MKLRLKLSLISTLLCYSSITTAQNPMMMAPMSANSPQQQANLLNTLAAKHGLGTEHSFTLQQEHAGPVGSKVTRLDHTYKGVRVYGSESVVVLDQQGQIMRETLQERRYGLGQSSQGLRASARDFDVTPNLSKREAIALAIQATSAHGVAQVAPSAELIVFPIVQQQRVKGKAALAESELNALDVEDVVTGYELAYLVKTRMLEGGKLRFFDSILSAKDGHLLQRVNAVHTVAGTGKSQYYGSVPLNTTQNGASFTLLDSSRGVGGKFGGLAVANANHLDQSTATLYSNASNTWGDGLPYSGGNTNSANGQTPAVNIMWGLVNTYDLMKNVVGWQALDGKNTAFYGVAHAGTGSANAFFLDSCNCMVYSDGNVPAQNYSTIDVTGHELGHGVTNATTRLVYSGESGGLNESFSDIHGEMAEAYAKGGAKGSVVPAGNDWQLALETGAALRNMIKPSKDGASPDAWSSTLGNIDVHYSSGPNNRMFYFLSQGSNATVGNDAYSSYLKAQPLAMTGIGNDAAYRIWFHAATTRFTSTTKYANARAHMIASAQELYGVGSKQDIAVQRAYAAINVGQDVAEGGALNLTQPSSISVALGATASFSVGATGGSAPYSFQWYKNGVAVAGANAATYSFTTQIQDNGAQFYCKVTDAKGASLTSNSAYLSLVAIENQLINNGSFEAGSSGWNGTTTAIGTFSNQPAYDGSKVARLGGKGTANTSSIYQTITIPARASSVPFSFALHIDSAETGSTAYDKLTVSIQNTAGTVLKTLATYSNANKAAGYQIKTFDLIAYKGQNVRIAFSASEDSSMQTSFVIDKVSALPK